MLYHHQRRVFLFDTKKSSTLSNIRKILPIPTNSDNMQFIFQTTNYLLFTYVEINESQMSVISIEIKKESN